MRWRMADAIALDARALAAPAERSTDRIAGWEAPALLLVTLLLLSIGLVTVYGTSAVKAQAQGFVDYHYVVRQAAGGAAGLVLMALASKLDYRWLRIAAWPLLIGLLVALLVIIAPGTQAIAPVTNGARRWLYLGPIGIQPSEFAKIILIAWTAALAVKKQDKLASLSRGLLPFLVIWLLVTGLIFLQPSLSAAVIVLFLAALVAFAGGARIGHFLLLAIVGLPLVWGRIAGAAYRQNRLATFLDPTLDPEGLSYQINQSLIAIGSGGAFGRGFGHGQQKYGFMPEPFNDFIFAMFSEEWGFAGVVLLIVLFGAFALIGYRIARAAPDLFGALLAIGLTNLVAVQAFLHMAVNLALIPTTGVTLPFISYGRSSLLVCMIAVGMLVNVARQAERRLE
jgi:cell division protein FtsW